MTKEEEVDLSEYFDYHDAHRQLERLLDDVYIQKRFQLLGRAKRLPRQLPGGQQRRVNAARALGLHPPFLAVNEQLGVLIQALRCEVTGMSATAAGGRPGGDWGIP